MGSLFRALTSILVEHAQENGIQEILITVDDIRQCFRAPESEQIEDVFDLTSFLSKQAKEQRPQKLFWTSDSSGALSECILL